MTKLQKEGIDNELYDFISMLVEEKIEQSKAERDRKEKVFLRKRSKKSFSKVLNIKMHKLKTSKVILCKLVSEHIDKDFNGELLTLEEFLEFDRESLLNSLELYGKIRFKRPCCSSYPGIWPFCKRNC